jgi:hypothetical protein
MIATLSLLNPSAIEQRKNSSKATNDSIKNLSPKAYVHGSND